MIGGRVADIFYPDNGRESIVVVVNGTGVERDDWLYLELEDTAANQSIEVGDRVQWRDGVPKWTRANRSIIDRPIEPLSARYTGAAR